MKLHIAFLGYNEEQTRRYFEQFAVDNAEQVVRFDRRAGLLLLQDGTKIRRISETFPSGLVYRFDQAIVADDRRGWVALRRSIDLRELGRRMESSPVPEEFRWLWYDLDAPEGGIGWKKRN